MTVSEFMATLKDVPADAQIICPTGLFGEQFRATAPAKPEQMHDGGDDWFLPCEKQIDRVRYCVGCAKGLPLVEVVSV